ncbi:MAG: RNA 2',3'-cyclic phosphodiesterase, partial [Candidatus Thiodiazotropha sp.]
MSEPRYFFALWPNKDAQDQLSALAHSSEVSEGRRHHADDLHITLVFLGQIAASQRRCIEDVAEGIRLAPFKLTIDHTGYWSRPKIFWASPGKTPQALKQLVADLNNGLNGCGFEAERRPYKPHVTLIRKARKVVSTQLEIPITWQVNDFVLASSADVGSSGRRYQVLRRWGV